MDNGENGSGVTNAEHHANTAFSLLRFLNKLTDFSSYSSFRFTEKLNGKYRAPVCSFSSADSPMLLPCFGVVCYNWTSTDTLLITKVVVFIRIHALCGTVPCFWDFHCKIISSLAAFWCQVVKKILHFLNNLTDLSIPACCLQTCVMSGLEMHKCLVQSFFPLGHYRP